MKIAAGIVLWLALWSASAYLLEETSKSSPHSPLILAAQSSGLQGFPNYIGETFGEDKANTFLNLINAAASFYRDDMEKNLKYLQTNMQAAYYRKGNQTFSVVIQVNSTTSITDTIIYNNWGNTYASFATGTSVINPTWSYYVYILERYDNWVLEYVPQLGQGKGMNVATVNEIKNIVLKRGQTGKCTCRETVFIQLDLNQFDHQYWNVVCHTAPISEGYVLVRD
jgi:hypothetical protein